MPVHAKQIGGASYGPPDGAAPSVMVEQVQAWDGRVRRGPEPTYVYWPNGVSQVGRLSGAAGSVATLIEHVACSPSVGRRVSDRGRTW